MNWDNYDKWRLASPYDDEQEVETFKTEKYNFYSLDENLINKFDAEIDAVEKRAIELEIDPEDAAEELAEMLGLYSSEEELLIEEEENERSETEYALQCRWDEKRGK